MSRMSLVVSLTSSPRRYILLSFDGMVKDRKCYYLAAMTDGKQRSLLFEGILHVCTAVLLETISRCNLVITSVKKPWICRVCLRLFLSAGSLIKFWISLHEIFGMPLGHSEEFILAFLTCTYRLCKRQLVDTSILIGWYLPILIIGASLLRSMHIRHCQPMTHAAYIAPLAWVQ